MDKNKKHKNACSDDEKLDDKKHTNCTCTDKKKDNEPAGKVWQVNENTTDSFSEKAQKSKTEQSDEEV